MHNAEFANEHSPGQLSNQDETQALPTMNLFTAEQVRQWSRDCDQDSQR